MTQLQPRDEVLGGMRGWYLYLTRSGQHGAARMLRQGITALEKCQVDQPERCSLTEVIALLIPYSTTAMYDALRWCEALEGVERYSGPAGARGLMHDYMADALTRSQVDKVAAWCAGHENVPH